MDEEEIDLGPGLPRVPFLGELEDIGSSNSNSIEDEGEEGGEDDDEGNEQSRKRAREPITIAELPLVIDDQPPLKASSPNRLPALEDYGGDGPIYSENDQYEILARATQENADIITEELKKVGFISPEFAYIKEWQRRRDPMLTILYGPNTVVEMPGPKPGDEPVKVRVIDHLLQSAHKVFVQSYGDKYTNFEMIQYVMETLMKSEDKHAKIFMLLCMLTINNSLQTQLACQYPVDGNEVNRLKPFLDKVKILMQDTFNTAYVNVPEPNLYNVEALMYRFLFRCITEYPG